MQKGPFSVFRATESRALESFIDASAAIAHATNLLADPSSYEVTYRVEDGEGELVAVRSNRRILGTFTKQRWGGRNNDDACFVEDVAFDATEAALLLPVERLLALEDQRDSTDAVGRSLVEWDGPCSVSMVDSVLAFFAVEHLDCITAAALAEARAHCAPKERIVKTVLLTIAVTMLVPDDKEIDLEEIANDLEYSVKAGTPGAVVQSTDMREAEWA